MYTINKRYLETKQIREEGCVRSEILATIIMDAYFCKNKNLNVGDEVNQNTKLPDIYTNDKKEGFEVFRCEHKIDFDKLDKIKNQKGVVSYDNNKKNIPHFHRFDWMKDTFYNCLYKKLKKLNEGNYLNCRNISLVAVKILRICDKREIDLYKAIYFDLIKKNSFQKKFKNLYLITYNSCYIIDGEHKKNKIKKQDIDFCECVCMMKKKIMLDKYERE